MNDPATAMNPARSVELPLELFNAMSACFYGGGPTYWEIRGIQAPQHRTRAPSERVTQAPDAAELGDPGGDRLPANPLRIQPSIFRPGFVPRGAAARELRRMTNKEGEPDDLHPDAAPVPPGGGNAA